MDDIEVVNIDSFLKNLHPKKENQEYDPSVDTTCIYKANTCCRCLIEMICREKGVEGCSFYAPKSEWEFDHKTGFPVKRGTI